MPTSKKKQRRKENRRYKERAEGYVEKAKEAIKANDGFRHKMWKLNVYVCPKKHLTTTVDVDEGVTPFMLGCKMPGCNEMAQSSFYPKQRPIPMHIPMPLWEWYKPDINKVSSFERDHVEKGGLLLRRRTSAQPTNHPDLAEA